MEIAGGLNIQVEVDSMIGVYFSGTGNSRYAAELFCKECGSEGNVFSIEDVCVSEKIREADEIVFSYPVQYSTVPKFVRDFIDENSGIWNGKKVFVIATMGLFSGDGSGILGRLLKKHGAVIVGGLHLKMPDSIADEKALKRPFEKNLANIRESEEKIRRSAKAYREGKPTKEGLGFFYRMAGLFGQRLYFGHMTKKYSSKLKINADRCIGCGLCEKLCPLENIHIKGKLAVPEGKCTMCYRCINRCPKQAITLLGKEIVEQTTIEKYLKK